MVAAVFEVAIAPVQGPKPGGFGVVRAGEREAGPVGSEVLAPRRLAFADGQMLWCDVAFDADLAANVLGDLVGAPALDAGDVELVKSARPTCALRAGRTRRQSADNRTQPLPTHPFAWPRGRRRASTDKHVGSHRRRVQHGGRLGRVGRRRLGCVIGPYAAEHGAPAELACAVSASAG